MGQPCTCQGHFKKNTISGAVVIYTMKKWTIITLFSTVLLLFNLQSGVVYCDDDFSDDLDTLDNDIDIDLKDNNDASGNSIKTSIKESVVPTIIYKSPNTNGLLFSETFDGDVFSRWIVSKKEKFSGQWKVTKRVEEALVGDLGLKVMDTTKHHGISTRIMNPLINNKGKDIVLSYEAKFEETLNCGGAYLKLFNTASLSEPTDLSEFDNETPYLIMFGPDLCGITNKVHFIIKTKNPLSGEWGEHHLKDPPRVPQTPLTHAYGFHISHDNTYSVYVDGEVVRKGSMHEDFEPPFTPQKEIDDLDDKKPSDWIDNPKIVDPKATKPDDWDENAPEHIEDPNASIPEAWHEDWPKIIPDPSIKKPEDWDDEVDGPWTAPMISNPDCVKAAGCGPWKRPLIPNPEYKGNWVAPLIDNPDYKGPWEPRKIPNPHYFVDENPHAIADINAIGFELWTVQNGILFDNIVISRSSDPVLQFVETTWKARNTIEKSQQLSKGPSDSQGDGITSYLPLHQRLLKNTTLLASMYPIPFGIVMTVIGLCFVWTLTRTKSPPTPTEISSGKTVKKIPPTTESSKGSSAQVATTAEGDDNNKNSSEEEEEEEEEEMIQEEEELKEKEKKPVGTRKRVAPKKD